jgi:hypothetical protein
MNTKPELQDWAKEKLANGETLYFLRDYDFNPFFTFNGTKYFAFTRNIYGTYHMTVEATDKFRVIK